MNLRFKILNMIEISNITRYAFLHDRKEAKM